jgi:signal transduction histidine kinase
LVVREPSLVDPGEQVKAVLDLLPIGVVTCDGYGELRLFNEHAVRLWGRRPAAGERFSGALMLRRRSGDPVGGDAPLASALRSGRVVAPVEILIERADATVISIESYAVPLFDGLGACVGAIELMREHLHLPRGLVDLRAETETFVRLSRSVSDQVRRVRELALETHGLCLEAVDVARVVIDVTERFAERARERSSTIAVDGWAVIARADRARLDQVVAQLVDNALDFGRGLPVELSIAQVGGRALVAVRDHGVGIARDQQPAIFERFAEGRGVGLWMVRRLIQEMDGTIEVATEPGFGATFTVALPAA